MHQINQKSNKTGLPPGTIVLSTGPKVKKTQLKYFSYSENSYTEKAIKSVDKLSGPADGKNTLWIDVSGLKNMRILEQVGQIFNLHPLLLEDVAHTAQRPKFEDYENILYIVVRMFTLTPGDKKIDSEQVSIIMGNNYIISFQEKRGDVFHPIREQIRSGKTRLRKMGADYLAYALIDLMVDHYFTVLEQVGEEINSLEQELLNAPSPRTLQRINKLRQEVMFLRRSVWPLRDVINRFQHDENKLVRKQTHIYLRDLYDHTIQVIESTETDRDILSGMVDLYLSSVSNRLNSIMKVLTIIATIFIPLTFITGIYGMNFKYMPEINWLYGYPFSLSIMAGVAFLMLWYFRKKNWL